MEGRGGEGRGGERGRERRGGEAPSTYSTALCLVVQKNEGGSGTIEGFDLNVEPVWKTGVDGSGVVVSILDDGE